MDRVTPSEIRYIKLGAGGRWETASLDQGRLHYGLASDPHDLASRGDWEGLNKSYRDAGLFASTATGYTNEARAFYDRDPNALWVTFARGRMWWALAEPEVFWTGGNGAGEGTRHRIAVGGWHDTDVAGVPLTLDRLSTKLTQLASYQRTICGLTSEQRGAVPSIHQRGGGCGAAGRFGSARRVEEQPVGADPAAHLERL